MPKKPELYVNNILPRYESLAEGNIEGLSTRQIASLNDVNVRFLTELGLYVNDEGEPEQLGWVPRIFVMGRDENGHDKMKTFSESGLEIGSREFWEQVQMGNVFAYPVGSEDPVQLQVRETGVTRAKLTYSRPVQTNELPALPVQPVKWYHRVLGFFHIGDYNDRVKRFDQDITDRENTLLKFSQMKQGRKGTNSIETENHEVTYERERKRMEAEEQERQKQEAEKKVQDFVQNVLKHHGDIEKGIYQMTSVFQPVPQFDPDLEKWSTGVPLMDGSLPTKDRTGLYLKKHFDALTVYDKDQIDLSKIKLGKSGESVSNEEFAAVTFFALWDNKNMMKAMENEESIDIWAKKSMQDLGYDEQQAEEILTAQSRNWMTADLFIVPPRDNEGIYFEKTTNLGREDAVKAFQAYQNGDKTKLAGIIARGLNKAAKDLVVEQKTEKFSEQTNGIMAVTSLMVDMMKKDPELEKLAKQQGLDENNLQAAKGLSEFHKLQKERAQAEYKMAKAIQDGTDKDMSKEQKKELLKPIIKARLTQERMVADNVRNCQPGAKKIDDIPAEAVVFTSKDIQETWRKDPQSRPDPGPGKVHMDTYNRMDRGVRKLFAPVSESMKNLGAKDGPTHLDAIADEIIEQEGLADKPVRDLFVDLNEHQRESKFNVVTAASKASQTIAKRLEDANKGKLEAGNNLEIQNNNLENQANDPAPSLFKN